MDDVDLKIIQILQENARETIKQIAVAKCARLSYLTFDKVINYENSSMISFDISVEFAE